MEIDDFQREGNAAVGAGEGGAVGIFHVGQLAGGEQAAGAGGVPVVAAMGAEGAVEGWKVGKGKGDQVAIDHRQGQFEALEQGAAFLYVGQRGGMGIGGEACLLEGVAEFAKAGGAEGGGEAEAVWCKVLEVLVQAEDRIVEGGERQVGQQKRVGLAGLRCGDGGGVKLLGGAGIVGQVEYGGEGTLGISQTVGEAAGKLVENRRWALSLGGHARKVVGGEGKFGHAGHHARAAAF